MEKLETYAEFLNNSFPSRYNNSEWFCSMSSFAFGKFMGVRDWWNKCSEQFSQMSGISGTGSYLYTYLKSCQFTEHFVNLKMDETNKVLLKLSKENEKLCSENQELKSIVYNMMDEIYELKEHASSLSDRLQELEVPIKQSTPLILI